MQVAILAVAATGTALAFTSTPAPFIITSLAAQAPPPLISTCFSDSKSSLNPSITRTTRLLGKSSSDDNSSILKEGRLVEFTSGSSNNKKGIGAIVGKEGKRNLKILTSTGRTVSVPPRSIKHVVPNGRVDVSDVTQIEEHESAAAAALLDDMEMGGQNVMEMWELLLEEDSENDASTNTIDLITVSELLLGDSTSISCYATKILLTEGVANYCFKELGGKLADATMYEPRQVHVVENMRGQAEIEAKEASKWDEIKQRIDDITSNDEIVMDIERESDEVQAALLSLESLACLANLSPEEVQREEKGNEDVASAKQFIQNIGRRATPETARTLLISLGIRGWDKHTNMDLIRLNIRTTFDQYLEDAAIDIALNPPPDLDKDFRMDLTHLSAFAIDDASTKEIDDALSVEILSTDNDIPIHSRLRLWVHIADPSRFIELGSPLDKEARKRGTSIYLPTGTISMFPMSLASGALSLNPGEVKCALSVGVMLDDAGGIDESTLIITPSLVKSTRLTYDQVDLLLDPFCMVDNGVDSSDICNSVDDAIDMSIETAVESLRQLQYMSEQRLQWRIDGGSMESISPYELPDMTVKATQSAEAIDGWLVDVYAKNVFAANRIVTECALLANEAMALYGMTHGVPLPFRGQEMDAISDDEINMTPEGPCRSWLAIQSSRPSQISTNPLPHAGLGLDVYVQGTSPVRRYADLALHHQIKSHLRGQKLPFPKDDSEDGSGDTVATMIGIARNAALVGRQLERPANDYWMKEFLRRKGSEITKVLVLSGDRWKGNVYKLFIPEFGAIFSYTSTASLANGQQIDMQSSALAELV